MKSKTGVGALLSCFAAVGLTAVVWWHIPGHRITEESCQMIEPGWTAEQVEALLGKPPGDYTSEPVECVGLIRGWPDVGKSFDELVATRLSRDERCRLWCGDDGVIEVHFDADGRVEHNAFHPVVRQRRPWIERLRGWVGL